MHCNHDIEHINATINILKDGTSGEDITWFYYPEKAVLITRNCEILNVLFLRGDTKNRILYCYISIYNALTS